MLIALLTFGCCISNCFADASWRNAITYAFRKIPNALPYLSLGCFVLTMMIEYPVIYLLLGKRLKAPGRLFLCVLLVNAITSPAVSSSTLALYFLNILPRFVWLELFLIEFAVVLVEFVMFKLIFMRMYRTQALEEPVSTRRTFLMSLAANFASVALGSVAEFPIMVLILGWQL